ncbi:4-hydroxy-3-methylbut-2-en-1-yl diphosphate reductase [Aureococcus anophagefferens]|nr:4-hydroxy-3-methylbut-2-en-1-yl diphosphate reductase [Aureococcus anophagefferens]
MSAEVSLEKGTVLQATSVENKKQERRRIMKSPDFLRKNGDFIEEKAAVDAKMLSEMKSEMLDKMRESNYEEGDVVILPAFGATLAEMQHFSDMGVTTVDTACPWVTKVWSVVDKQVQRSMTTIIHGKYAHEEAIATASMCDDYLMVKNIDEAEYERQDAIHEMVDDESVKDLDFILVVGGFDSSNTAHLVEIPYEAGIPVFHINEADCISETNAVSHRLVSGEMAVEENWLPTDRPARIGVTSGASTPDADVQAPERLVLLKSVISTDAAPAAPAAGLERPVF